MTSFSLEGIVPGTMEVSRLLVLIMATDPSGHLAEERSKPSAGISTQGPQ